MRRPGGADFAPSAHVFPGGSQHPEDDEFADPIRAAAVRELFEEVGILLARRLSGGRFAGAADCERVRVHLAAGATFGQALAAARLAPAFERLTPLARWVTPIAIRRRFDTHFFVARRPAGQPVLAQPGEVDGWLWIAPADALSDGGPTLVHATRRILESVAADADAARLVARLRRRRGGLVAVMPVIERLADGTGFRISDGATPA